MIIFVDSRDPIRVPKTPQKKLIISNFTEFQQPLQAKQIHTVENILSQRFFQAVGNRLFGCCCAFQAQMEIPEIPC